MSIYCNQFEMSANQIYSCDNCIRNRAVEQVNLIRDNFIEHEKVDPYVIGLYNETANHSDEMMEQHEKNKKKRIKKAIEEEITRLKKQIDMFQKELNNL